MWCGYIDLNILYHHSKLSISICCKFIQQESIPVGCVPLAFVVRGVGTALEGVWSRGLWPSSGRYYPPPMDRMTHACENITFPQFRWREVNIKKSMKLDFAQQIFR